MNGPIWLAMAPCGPCGVPVPRDRGCVHWRPAAGNGRSHFGGTKPLTVAERSARYKARKRAGLVGAKQMGRPPLSDEERARRAPLLAARKRIRDLEYNIERRARLATERQEREAPAQDEAERTERHEQNLRAAAAHFDQSAAALAEHRRIMLIKAVG